MTALVTKTYILAIIPATNIPQAIFQGSVARSTLLLSPSWPGPIHPSSCSRRQLSDLGPARCAGRSTQVRELTKWFPFREGPFLLLHTDLYCSNIMTNTDYYILSVINLENAIVGPWEVVEFNKQLSIVPLVMYGPLFMETEEDKAM
jgi:hypothetical protein